MLGPALVDPWSWTPHPLALAVVVLCAGGYALALRRLGPSHAPLAKIVSRAQVVAFASGLVALGLALTWPVADLAQRTSATAHVVQQLLLVLVVPPLLLLGLPRWLLALATRSRPADAAVRLLAHPATAFALFNLALLAAWLPPVIDAEARLAAVDVAVHAVLLVAGLAMWAPAMRILPGARALSTAARIAYLFAQSVVFNFPALILIFAAHPLYPVYAAHVQAVLGLSPVVDQQLAGATAKFVGFSVLLGAVGLVLNRAQLTESAGGDPDPLLWDDVERELRRLERRSKGTTDAS